MKRTTIFVFLLLCAGLCLTSCSKKEASPADATNTENQQSTDGGEAQQDEAYAKLKDITLPDANGKTHSLLEEVKKNPVTLIDFWASWCGPCMREMPNVKQTYEQFKNRGFNIIGLSLDNDREAWQQAVSNMELTWLQLSDLKGWDSAAAQLYNVQSIPFTMLVNSEGEIVETNLRGEELQHAVAEMVADAEDTAKLEADNRE